jgi:SAM-dependent methyltransferase
MAAEPRSVRGTEPGLGPSIVEVRTFWNANPVGAEFVDAEPGTAEFFAHFDAMREAEDCEPYSFSNLIHGFDQFRGKRVLDVGCGNGYVLSRYARQGAIVSGVDLTAKAIELSRKRFALERLEAELIQIDGVNLPFPDAHFDIVCSMGVLHHISDPRPTVSEIARVLKPGGTLIAMLYYRYSYKAVVLTRLKRIFDPRYRGMSQQQAINRNDGAGCPLAELYSRQQAQQLFVAFEQREMRLNQLSWKQLFLVPGLHQLAGRVFGSPNDTWLARHFGWNLYINARKPKGKHVE